MSTPTLSPQDVERMFKIVQNLCAYSDCEIQPTALIKEARDFMTEKNMLPRMSLTQQPDYADEILAAVKSPPIDLTPFRTKTPEGEDSTEPVARRGMRV